MSGIINKIKEAVHGDSHSAPEGSHGPHNTRAANAADPRVDSDRDGSHQVGTGTGAGRTAGHGEYGSTNPFSSNTHSSTTGTHANPLNSNTHSSNPLSSGTHNNPLSSGSHNTNPLSSGTHGTTEGTHGPHSSRMANAADPRVDSDRDGSRQVGGGTGMGSGLGSGMGSGMGHSGAHTGSSGLHSTGGAGGFGSSNTHSTNPLSSSTHGTAEGAQGPHSSRMANAADPRVDSDRDGSRQVGGGGMGMGSGMGHSGASSGLHSHSAPGPAPGTAGPHKSDMLNKIDPRVDSNLDGSKTVGGDKTFQQ